MDDFEIYKSSTTVEPFVEKVYPFKKLNEGESFYVKCDQVIETSFRSLVSAAATKLDKNLKCIKHKERGYFEVACYGSDKKKLVRFQVAPSSPRALETPAAAITGRDKYGLANLPEGMSVIIPFDAVNFKLLSCAVASFSRKTLKRYIIVVHEEYKVYEVANRGTPENFLVVETSEMAKRRKFRRMILRNGKEEFEEERENTEVVNEA